MLLVKLSEITKSTNKQGLVAFIIVFNMYLQSKIETNLPDNQNIGIRIEPYSVS